MWWFSAVGVLVLAVVVFCHLWPRRDATPVGEIRILEYEVTPSGEPIGSHQSKELTALCKVNDVFVRLCLLGKGMWTNPLDIARDTSARSATWGRPAHPWVNEDNLLEVKSASFGWNPVKMIEAPANSAEILKVVAVVQEHVREQSLERDRIAFKTFSQSVLEKQNVLLAGMRITKLP